MTHYVPHGSTARAIATDIELAITEGRLGRGEALPPVRKTALELAVSPSTVNAAYQTLRRRGLVISQGRRGLRVSPRPVVAGRPALVVPNGVRDLCNGNPDPSFLPPLEWALAGAPLGTPLYGQAMAFAPLLNHSAQDFASSGVATDHLTVVNGALDGIDRILSTYLRPGDGVLVEDPTYAELIDLLHAMGLTPVGVPLDENGPLPGDFAAALEHVRAVVLTTRAHNPTGTLLSPGRAKQLSEQMVVYPDLLVVDNDYNAITIESPYTLVTKCQPRWAVVRSLSKALGPDLRIAMVAGDATTITQVESRQRISAGWVSHILQQIAFRLWTAPGTAERVQHATNAYADRRQALIAALSDRGITAHGSSGLNVYIPVDQEAAVTQSMLTKGWAIRPGEGYRINTRQPFVRITTSTLTPDEAPHVAEDLFTILGGSSFTKHG